MFVQLWVQISKIAGIGADIISSSYIRVFPHLHRYYHA